MQRDYAYRQARHLADLEAAESIGRRAGERAVRRLNPVKLKSGAMPIVFDPRVGAGLLGHLIGAITGSAIARKTSRSEEHTSELQSLMRISSAVFCLQKKHTTHHYQ